MIAAMGAVNRLFGCVMAAGMLALAGVARAENMSFPQHTPNLSLPTIVAAPANASFTATVNSASGAVTVTSGAVVLGASTATTPTVRVACAGPPGNCKNTNYTIVIVGTGSVGGRPASISAMEISGFSGTGVSFVSTSGSGSTLTVNVRGTENSWSLSFKLGASILFSSGTSTGNTTINYTITAS